MSNNRTKAQAEALVRTITNHVGTVARTDVWKANKKLFEGEEFIATLDSRTSSVCIHYSGRIFPIGEGVYPPLHYNCRSIRVPKLKKEFDLNIDTTRSSADGQVRADTTYNQWLKRQSAETQNEVLGVAKGKLYRKSGKPIDRFIDLKGKYYTLEELKEKDKLV